MLPQESAHGSSAVTSSRLPDPGVLDFSSASEDEDPCGSRSKATGPITPEHFRASSAANGNLCALLQKNLSHWAQRASESSHESQSDENTIGSDQEEIKATERGTKKKLYSNSSDEVENEEEERNEISGIKSCDMEEIQEQDVIHHYNEARPSEGKLPNKERRPDWVRLVEQRRRREKEVESFTSSEDEAPLNDGKSKNLHASTTQKNTSTLQTLTRKHHKTPKRFQFTGLIRPADHSGQVQLKEATGTIDTLLGMLMLLFVVEREIIYTLGSR